MPLHLSWPDLALRLFFTVLGGCLIGMNREEGGHAAGLRTTVLVCAAASLSMILMNELLVVTGKTPDSFVVMDVMRLPLGILSGMGFIGAGAILHKGNLVHGVTTAATLWFVTVMGLCFGSGLFVLGTISLVLGLFILSGLKIIEYRSKQDRHATLTILTGISAPSDEEIVRAITEAGYKIRYLSLHFDENVAVREFSCEVHWRGTSTDPTPPPFLKTLARRFGFRQMKWQTQK
jgi:putative Mg2+ transporter-C (MgtC) family protein